ncbi:response regulator [Geomicrobium sediminis]|uniref:Transcriptional regulatory protein n=1 Tax=Geomicrobium sediminis TaxID=1347788 RepID=A0ABS2PBZ0_9BACL|nr:response regulator [Geomicrobium sediminis]MBM7632802.1 CitB family two-component system response regulator CitT [Geomicrobium sediminis]
MNVVIAEDDFRVSSIHETYVEEMEGFDVTAKALNGKELRASLEEHTVDLILLDIYFPDERGTNLMKHIRNQYPDIDIIVISASDRRDDLLVAKRYGVYDFLVKPVTKNRFQAALRQYKEHRSWFAQPSTFSESDAKRFLTHTGQAFSEEVLPTGIDSITLNKVAGALSRASDGLTIEETCRKEGISRTTARRYLEHLVASGKAKTQLSYGVIGRPERKYVLTSS